LIGRKVYRRACRPQFQTRCGRHGRLYTDFAIGRPQFPGVAAGVSPAIPNPLRPARPPLHRLYTITEREFPFTGI